MPRGCALTGLQIAVACGTLLSLAVGAWNAWTRVQMQLELLRLKSTLAESFSAHVLEQEAAFSAIRLELSERYVSHESLDKTLSDFKLLVNQLGTQIRALQRVVDRYIGQQPDFTERGD